MNLEAKSAGCYSTQKCVCYNLARGQNECSSIQKKMLCSWKEKARVKRKSYAPKKNRYCVYLQVAYLASFFEEINAAQLSGQGNMMNILTGQDKVAVFFANCIFTNAELEL